MISLILPSYNEAENISDYIKEAHSVLKSTNYKYEIIVIDDGSRDGTGKILEQLNVTFFRHNINKGYGSAIKTGIEKANFDTIIISDVDGTYPCKHMPEIINKYLNSKDNNNIGIDMIVGQRSGKYYEESLSKRTFRRILKFIVEWTAGTKIKDINSGFRIFSKKTILVYFPQLSNSFSFSTSSTLAYLLSNKSVDYYPIEYLKREGKSHVKLFRDSLRTMQYILQAILFYNPLKIFILITFFFLIISLFLLTTYIIYRSNLILALLTIFSVSTLFSMIAGLLTTAIKVIINSEN
jgi:glycosyltransferase involved in cell wall biosynthesis